MLLTSKKCKKGNKKCELQKVHERPASDKYKDSRDECGKEILRMLGLFAKLDGGVVKVDEGVKHIVPVDKEHIGTIRDKGVKSSIVHYEHVLNPEKEKKGKIFTSAQEFRETIIPDLKKWLLDNLKKEEEKDKVKKLTNGLANFDWTTCNTITCTLQDMERACRTEMLAEEKKKTAEERRRSKALKAQRILDKKKEKDEKKKAKEAEMKKKQEAKEAKEAETKKKQEAKDAKKKAKEANGGDKKFKKDNTDDQLDQERREVWNNKRVAKGGRASKKPKIC